MHCISNTNLNGRWQILKNKPLTICDTAHNEDGIKIVHDGGVFLYFDNAEKLETVTGGVEVTGDLSFVKGNEWLAGNISYHLDERPKWIYDSNNIFLCNINLECIKYK